MGAAVRSHRSLRDVRCRRPRPRRVLDQRRRRTRFGAGRTDRRRSRVPGRDVHPRRGPAGPAPPRRHRSLATPPGLPGREAGALRIERAPPPRPRAGVGALPRGPAGVMGDRRPHTPRGDLVVEGSQVLHLPSLRRDRVRRAAIVVDITAEGRPLSIVGTHMSHLQYGSHRHYGTLYSLLRTAARPDAVLLGDMNLWGPPVRAFLPRLAPGGEGAHLAGLEPPQPDRPHSGPRRRAGRLGVGAPGRRVRSSPGAGRTDPAIIAPCSTPTSTCSPGSPSPARSPSPSGSSANSGGRPRATGPSS